MDVDVGVGVGVGRGLLGKGLAMIQHGKYKGCFLV